MRSPPLALSLIVAASLAGACTAAVAPPTMAQAIPGAKAVATPIVRTAKTTSGQPLRLPQGAAEMVATAIDFPPGGRVMLHRHPWSRFLYVEKGRVAIINHDTGATVEAAAGQALAEVIGQWHEGVALDGQPARLVVIDLVPPGVVNMEMPK
ncbi:cupin domain-containing protein [Sphingomonas sp.]|uniref:cupin domain-containing protein n=1 Tax=Sphingomonas sp. TaxID=28214 RepID=UPI00286BE8F2|nr:cupin domain-containing protein [Sphingomonas sp.]